MFLVAQGLGQGWKAGISQIPKLRQPLAVLQSTLAQGSLLGGREGRSGRVLLGGCVGAELRKGLITVSTVGPSEQLQEPMSPPQPPSGPYVESESLLPLDSPFLSFRALAKEEDLSLRLSLGQRTIFGFL